MIKIILADDHKMFLDGLLSILEGHPEYEVVKTFSGGQEAIDYLKFNGVGIAILDIDMPKPDGIQTTIWIREKRPETKVLIVSMFRNERKIKMAIDAGVDGYILKDAGKEEFLRAIQALSNSESYFGQDVMSVLVKAQQMKTHQADAVLSRREEEILGLIGKGKRSKEIADILNIASTTVDTHMRNIRSKLNLQSRLELVVFAKDNGYV